MGGFISFVLLLILTLSITSCSSNTKNNGPAAGSSTTATTATEQPATTSVNSISSNKAPDAEWPSDLVGDLPKPDCKIDKIEKGKKGSITENATMIELSEMNKESADKYIDLLKVQGFNSQVNTKVGEAIEFIGMKDDKSASVQFTYSTTTEKCSIIYSR